MTRPFLTLAAALLLAGCAGSPLPRIYVLGAPAEPDPGVINDSGKRVIALPTVALPDYLDSSDIVLRDGQNELKPSRTGRWGERLSMGITQALEGDLARRLPGVLVIHNSMSGQPSATLLVNVEAFDVHSDGRCVLTARWMVPGDSGQAAMISQQGTFVTQAASLSDADVVAAMAAAIDQLADRIAPSLRRGVARPR